jgi:hypothetical protein
MLGFIEALFSHLLARAVGQGIHSGIRAGRLLPCTLLRRDEEIRFSFSALLRLETAASSWVLVRNIHRPESFGPFGGVVKRDREAADLLRRLEFRPDRVGLPSDMKTDLRGFVPRKHLPRLVRWHGTKTDREDGAACLNREIREELAEWGMSKAIRRPHSIRVKLVRSVTEGPEWVPGKGYMQFRIFDIYDLVDEEESLRFSKRLAKASKTNSGILVASSEEITAGRSSNGELIGHHACYLLTSRHIRPDLAPPVLRQETQAT